MMQNIDKYLFDFFRKQKTMEKPIKHLFIMRLCSIVFSKIYNFISKFALTIFLVFIFCSFFVTILNSYFLKRTEYTNAKISLVKEIDEAHFSSIVSYIRYIKEKELEQIRKNYFSAVFINEKITPIRMDLATRETANMMNESTKYYDLRIETINNAYQLIKRNKADLIPKNDYIDPIDSILFWDNIYQVKTIRFREDIANNSSIWMKYLDNSIALDEYLNNNKEKIANKN